ncbi:hypothetical protein ONE63_010747 [Megalurothrips usitatus]|nr:hypothetical protein ONE63_010747 [Megalurothrips usitatus]
METKGTNGTSFDVSYCKPEERSRWDSIRLAIYNPSTREIFGRTCQSWGAITLFYSVFYVILAAFFAICMKGMLVTIDEKIPYFTQDYSLIGSSPGLGFRPIGADAEKEGSLIWFDAKNATNVEVWTSRIEDFLKPYKNPSSLKGEGRNQVRCDYATPNPGAGKVCAMDMDNWGTCQQRFGYGYNKSSPCVFVKLNKIFGWVPEYYNDTADLPKDMPQELKDHIDRTPISKRNTIWVSCEGENPADIENVGPIEFFPERGIPGFYFPYENQDGYLSPVVAIHFVRPNPHVLINIECRAWARNINYRRHNTLREGSVHFEIMID